MKQTKSKIKFSRKKFLVFSGILILLLSLTATNSNAAFDYYAYNPLNVSFELTQSYTSQNQFGGDTYSSPAFDFHIFAKEVELNSHTNGNIATNILSANGHAFGADEINHLNKREDNYIRVAASGISNIASNGYIVLGNSVSTQINTQDKRIKIGHSQNHLDQSTSAKIYQETARSSNYINIEKELSYLTGISRSLSLKTTSHDVSLSDGSSGTKNIIIKNPGGNHYLNINATELSGTSKTIINITLPERTTLIINVDMNNSNSNTLKNVVVQLNNYHNGEEIANTYCGLLWNLYDSSKPDRTFVSSNYTCVGMSDYFFGTILAPAANITYGAVNGSIIAQKTKQGGQESHRFDFTGYEDPSFDVTTETSQTASSEENTTQVPSSEEITTQVPSSEESTTRVPPTDISTPISTQITTDATTQSTTIQKKSQITSSPTKLQTSSRHIKTGDDTKIFLLTILLLMSTGITITILIYKKYNSK